MQVDIIICWTLVNSQLQGISIPTKKDSSMSDSKDIDVSAKLAAMDKDQLAEVVKALIQANEGRLKNLEGVDDQVLKDDICDDLDQSRKILKQLR